MIGHVTPITFAHRGARVDLPENTLAAFRRGLDLGATGLETDAWLSADDEVVLVHDAYVGRGLRRRGVASSTASELAVAGVPRLVDLYEALGCDYELSIDLKAPGVGERILGVAAGVGGAASERLWLCSPDLGALGDLVLAAGAAGTRLVHSRRLAALPVAAERHAADLAAAGIAAMNLHHTEWTAGLVALFDRFGVRAFAWDAQEVRHLRAVLSMGVDAVYCDRPQRMVAAVEEWRAHRAGPGEAPSEQSQPGGGP